MNFRASLCEPLNENIIELGPIPADKVVETFMKIPWSDLDKQLETARPEEINYSPSFEIENKDNSNALVFSSVAPDWMIFYKRPKKLKLLGLFEYTKAEHMTDIDGQTLKDVQDCLNALLNNDLAFLENKIG